MQSHIDHLVLAVPDLATAMEEIKELLGVEPAMGGRHPGWGTWNALVSLGDRTYLELIAADPENQIPGIQCPDIFTSEGTARMIGWFAKCQDLKRNHEVLMANGVCTGEVKAGSRMLPDGRTLQWQLTDPNVMVLHGIFPMLIDWGHSPHPAATAPRGCRLDELRLFHPEATEVERLMSSIGIEQTVHQGEQPSISVVIEAPTGKVQLP